MIIDRPKGVVPRAKGCGLGPEYAEFAQDIRLLEGRFEPWRMPVQLLEFGERVHTAHLRDCCWTGTAVPNARYVDAGVPHKTYLSAPDQRPVVTDSVCESDWTYLGYPVPGDPVAIVDTAVDKSANTQLRTYRITYGTDCEEGPASCPSAAVYSDKGQTVRIQLPEAPDGMWGATHVNIYRSEALWDSESGLVSFNPNEIDGGWHSSSTESDYFLVATLPITDLDWVDTPQTVTGRLLSTEDLIPPVEGMQLVDETAQGSLVGFHGCDLFFSERNQYWGFPYRSVHSFPHTIVDVAVCENIIFVLTCESAFIVDDNVDCSESSARPVREIKEQIPAACGTRVLAVDGGVLYSSLEGLIYLKLDGSYTIASRRAFGKDEWRSVGPTGIRLGKGCDHLFVSTPEGRTYVWVLSFDESGYLPDDVTTLSFCPEQWVEDKGLLYFLMGNAAYQFNAGDYLRMLWKQVEQRSTSRETLSAIKGEYVKKKVVDFNTLSVYKEGTLSAVRPLTPKGSRIRPSAATCTQLELKGRHPMCWIGAGAGLNDIERRPT